MRVNICEWDGNAFSIMGRTMELLRKAGVDARKYLEEAMSGDYEHLIFVTLEYLRRAGFEVVCEE